MTELPVDHSSSRRPSLHAPSKLSLDTGGPSIPDRSAAVSRTASVAHDEFEVLKDGFVLSNLISLDGLYKSWTGLNKRVRRSETRLASMGNSIDAFGQTYVKQAEFAQRIEDGIVPKFEMQRNRLDRVDERLQAVNEQVHGCSADLLRVSEDNEARNRRMDAMDDTIKMIAAQDAARHEEALKSIKLVESAVMQKLEPLLAESGQMLRRSIDELRLELEAQSKDISALAEKLRIAQEQSIPDVMSMRQTARPELVEAEAGGGAVKVDWSWLYKEFEALATKEELYGHVATAVTSALEPVQNSIQVLTSDIDQKVGGLIDADRSMASAHRELLETFTSTRRRLEEQMDGASMRIELCASSEEFAELSANVNSSLTNQDKVIDQLRFDTMAKLQEIVDRVSEFQIILEDHEHALQHQAEEFLNRSTKYDLVLLQQQVDKCALKEKVDGHIMKLQSAIEWQTAQLEALESGRNNFSRDRSEPGTPQARSRRNLARSRQMSVDKGALSYMSQGGSSACSVGTEASAAPAANSGGGSGLKTPHPEPEISAPTPTATSEKPSPTDQEVLRDQDPSTEQRITSKEAEEQTGDERISERPHDVGANHVFQLPMMDYDYDDVGGQMCMDAMESTSVYSLLRMQLETLAKVVLNLGDLVTRPGLTREARESRQREAMDDIVCVVQWLIYKQAPLSWNLQKLTTRALASMNVPSAAAEDDSQDDGLSRAPADGRSVRSKSLRSGRGGSSSARQQLQPSSWRVVATPPTAAAAAQRAGSGGSGRQSGPDDGVRRLARSILPSVRRPRPATRPARLNDDSMSIAGKATGQANGPHKPAEYIAPWSAPADKEVNSGRLRLAVPAQSPRAASAAVDFPALPALARENASA